MFTLAAATIMITLLKAFHWIHTGPNINYTNSYENYYKHYLKFKPWFYKLVVALKYIGKSKHTYIF